MAQVYEPLRVETAKASQQQAKSRIFAVAIITIIVILSIAIGGYYLVRNWTFPQPNTNGTCNRNSQCPAEKPVCDTAKQTCRECLTKEDCGDCQECTEFGRCRDVGC